MPGADVQRATTPLTMRAYWLDDEPDSVTPFVEALESVGICVHTYARTIGALEDIETALVTSGTSEPYDVGIADLLLNEDPTQLKDGIGFAEEASKTYYRATQGIARIGYVTAHEDLFSPERRESVPFAFRYNKLELDDSIGSFLDDIRRSALSWRADLAALTYDREHPPECGGSDGLRHCHSLFGYVRECSGDSMLARLWNPRTLNSERLRRFQRGFMERSGITTEGDVFRIAFLEGGRPQALVCIAERIEAQQGGEWMTLRPEFRGKQARGRRYDE